MQPTSLIKYLAIKATEELAARGHERWILKCYRKNKNIAEQAKVLTLEIPKENIKNCRGALFTFHFKRLMTN